MIQRMLSGHHTLGRLGSIAIGGLVGSVVGRTFTLAPSTTVGALQSMLWSIFAAIAICALIASVCVVGAGLGFGLIYPFAEPARDVVRDPTFGLATSVSLLVLELSIIFWWLSFAQGWAIWR